METGANTDSSAQLKGFSQSTNSLFNKKPLLLKVI